MFDINTSRDLLNKLEADFEDLKADPMSARHALNAVVTAYHLHEWVWGEWLGTDFVTWKAIAGQDRTAKSEQQPIVIRDRDSFRRWLKDRCYWFEPMEELTNGSKHFARDGQSSTHVASRFGSGPYGLGPFHHSFLYVDLGASKGVNDRYRTITRLIEDAVVFWRWFFDEYRPDHPQEQPGA